MHFVSQDGTINTNPKFVWSCPYVINQYSQEEIRVCQNQEYYAIYCKLKNYVKFLKNQKIQQRILLQKDDYILSVTLNGFLQALLCDNNLRIYFNKKKLITKCLNRKYYEQITFTNDNQIILKSRAELHDTTFEWEIERYPCEIGVIPPFQIYNFITKIFTNCDVGGSSEKYYYEYCPVNDIILIPSGNFKANQISVWSVSQGQVTNQISVQGYLCDFEMKMSQSGQQLLVRDHQSNVLYIYSFGQKVILQKKISYLKIKLDKTWNIQWILNDQYFLLQQFYNYKILKNNNEIIDCQLLKQNARKGKQQQVKQIKNEANKQIVHNQDVSKKKIHIIMQKRLQFFDYYSIIL